MKIKNIVNSTKFALKKYAPEILTGIAGASIIISNITCAKNTRKYDKALKDREDEIFNKLDKAAVWIENYWPTVLLTTLSVVSCAASLKISKKRQATILLALNAVERKFAEYKKVLYDTNPDAYASQQTEYMKNRKACQQPQDVGPGEELFYEPILDYYFVSTRYLVEKAMNKFNELLQKNGYVSLYTMYDLLDAECELSDIDKKLAMERGWCNKDTFESGMNETVWIDWSDEGLEEVDPSAEDDKDRYIRILKIMNPPNYLSYDRVNIEYETWC